MDDPHKVNDHRLVPHDKLPPWKFRHFRRCGRNDSSWTDSRDRHRSRVRPAVRYATSYLPPVLALIASQLTAALLARLSHSFRKFGSGVGGVLMP